MIDKKQWFPVRDSLTNDEEGNEFYNVEAKFSDHPILNVEKSRIARHNVYDLGIVLHTRVLRTAAGERAIKNSSSHVMRFDKGEDTRVRSMQPGPEGNPVLHYDGSPGMGQEAFQAAVSDIMRCWEAWEHYQLFRKSPVHPMEEKALEVISQKPKLKTVKMVDIGGTLVPLRPGEDDEDEDSDPSEPEQIKQPSRPAPKGRRSKAA